MLRQFVIALMTGLALLALVGTPARAVSNSLLITRVQAGVAGNTSGEFVQLYNASETDLDTRGWTILVDGKVIYTFDAGVKANAHVLLSYKDALGQPYISDADGYFPAMAKTNVITASAGHIAVVDASSTVIDELKWGLGLGLKEVSTGKVATRSLDATGSYIDTDSEAADVTLQPTGGSLLSGGLYEITTDEPGEELPDDEVSEDEEPLPEPEVIEYARLWVSELLPNPASPALDAEKEYIELYNPNDFAVDTKGYRLTTGLNNQYSFILPSYVIAPKGYLVLYSSETKLTLANTTSKATLSTPDEAYTYETPSYPKIGEDQSWAYVNGAWQHSDLPTPGVENMFRVIIEESESESSVVSSSPAPCPVGKYRNPDTNRCRNIETAVASLIPCDEDEERNPSTNRCRKVAVLASSLTACQSGYERNPDTNRCRKIASSESSLKPCEPGQERNPATNRCRKIVALSGSSSADTAASVPLEPRTMMSVNYWIIGSAITGVAVYGVYEWRREILGVMSKLKARVMTH